MKSEVEKKSAINLQKELEREREFLKQNTEALKNYEIQRDYLSKENEFLSMENKELEIIRHNQQETILNVKTNFCHFS